MASVVDICNLAVSHLGEEPDISAISPPDGSANSRRCAVFYPMARDVALEDRNWTWALKRVALAVVTPDVASAQWEYAYALPSDAVRVLRVIPSGATDETRDAVAFHVEGSSILTTIEDAECVYLQKVTDTTKFSAKFREAVSWQLAHYLCGPMNRDIKIKEWCRQNYLQCLSDSAASNAASATEKQDQVPNWIATR